MPTDNQDQKNSPIKKEISFKECLENSPPASTSFVYDLGNVTWGGRHHADSTFVVLPVLSLHCEETSCLGVKVFEAIENKRPIERVNTVRSILTDQNYWHDQIIYYRCRNCLTTVRTYAVSTFCNREVILEGAPPVKDIGGQVYKYGEHPPFGPQTPARVITMIGPDREYFLKGRRAEFQGMGIGAFGYYRRVVENQKNRLIEEIIRVAEKIGSSKEMLDDLREAQKQTQFSTAVGAIKHGIPTGLMMDGHNPLNVLHTALSKGLHEQSDEECLALATSIRVVLVDLADRLGHALKERDQLSEAVNKLVGNSSRQP